MPINVFGGGQFHFTITRGAPPLPPEPVPPDPVPPDPVPVVGPRPEPASLASYEYPAYVSWRPTSGTIYTMGVGYSEAQQDTFLASVPSGTVSSPSIVVWPSGNTWSRVNGVQLNTGTNYIIHWGYGATLNMTGDGSSSNHSGFKVNGATFWKILGMEVQGANTYAGTNQAYLAPGSNGESSMGIAIYGVSTDGEIADCYVHNQYGDNLYNSIQPNDACDRVSVHHDRFSMAGRQSITWHQGNDTYIYYNIIEDAGGAILDFEDSAGVTIRLNRFYFRFNYCDRWMWYWAGGAFDSGGTSMAYSTGDIFSPLTEIYIEDNTFTGGPMGNGSVAHPGTPTDNQVIGIGYAGTSDIAKTGCYIRRNDLTGIPAGLRGTGFVGIRIEYCTNGAIADNTGTTGLTLTATNVTNVPISGNT